MSDYRVIPGQMTQHGEEFVSEIQGLQSSVDGLLSIWKGGSSADAFRTAYDGENNLLIQFKDRVQERGENIVTSARIMADNEEELTAMGSNLFPRA